MGNAQRIRRRQKERLKAGREQRQARPKLGLAFVILCLLLAVATLAVYWQATKFPLINTDDRDYVTHNAMVKAGITGEGLRWAFNVGVAGNWHPLTWMSHMLDSELYGPAAPTGPGPGGRHLTNLILHVTSTLLLFLVLTRMTGYIWRCAFVAALFALHPQHVESVAWVAERKDVLSTLFLMLTLWSYSWYTDKPGIFRYSLVFISLSLGLMAKPMLVTVPVVLLLLDFWPLKRFGNQLGKSNWALVWEKVPLLAPCIVSGVLTWNAQKLMLAINSLDAMPLSKRIPNAVMSYAIYITKMFWPSRLGNYYPQPRGGWPEEQVALAVLGLAVVTYFCIRKIASRPYLLTGWLWYMITLVPVIGLAQVGGQARADRYTYVPLIGLFLIIAFIVPDLLLRVKGSGEPNKSPWPARSLGVAAVAVIVALSMVTYVQIGYWKDGIIAARRAIAVTEDNWFELQSLGSQLEDSAEEMARQGKRDEAAELAGEAITQLQASLAIEPGCVDAHNDLGRALAATGDREGAIREYLAAIELNPRHLLSYNNLGNTYLDLRRYDDAIQQYQQALDIDVRNIYANYNLGIAYQSRGDIDAALQQFLTVLQLQPNDYFAYWARYNAAIFSRQKGDLAEATRLLQEAVEVNRVAGVDPEGKAAEELSNIESH